MFGIAILQVTQNALNCGEDQIQDFSTDVRVKITAELKIIILGVQGFILGISSFLFF